MSDNEALTDQMVPAKSPGLYSCASLADAFQWIPQNRRDFRLAADSAKISCENLAACFLVRSCDGSRAVGNVAKALTMAGRFFNLSDVLAVLTCNCGLLWPNQSARVSRRLLDRVRRGRSGGDRCRHRASAFAIRPRRATKFLMALAENPASSQPATCPARQTHLKFPKHDVGIFRIGQEAIVAAVERFPLVEFCAVYRLEFFGRARIAKAKHGMLDDQKAAGLECARQIGHRLLKLGKADAMATLRRRRRNVQISMTEDCHGKNGIVAGARLPLRRPGYSKSDLLSLRP